MLQLRPLVLLIVLTGCQPQPQKQPEGSAMPGFVDDYFTALFEWSPSTATAAGFHQYDSKLEDFSAAAIGRRAGKLKQLQSDLARVRAGKISADEAIDAEILDGQI